MKWLKRKIKNWLNNDDQEYFGAKAISLHETNSLDGEPILHFRIFSANNGKVLEFRHYDRVKDRSHNSTYIISKDEDIAAYVGKCLSLEMLK